MRDSAGFHRDRNSPNTPWASLVCFLIHTQPDLSLVVSIMERGPTMLVRRYTHVNA